MFNYGFYDAESNYGYKPIPGPWGKAKSYLDTYPGGVDAELNPEAYYTHVLSKRGFGGTDNRSNAARGMYGRLFDAYGAARLKNNELKWKDFIDPFDFENALNSMNSSDLGVNRSNVAPMDVRWLPR